MRSQLSTPNGEPARPLGSQETAAVDSNSDEVASATGHAGRPAPTVGTVGLWTELERCGADRQWGAAAWSSLDTYLSGTLEQGVWARGDLTLGGVTW